VNGDIFTDLDITAMIDLHWERKAKVTIALTPVDDPTPYGLVETGAANRVTRFVEKPSPGEITTNMINAGTYILEPEILAQIPAQTNVSIEREVFPRLLAKGEPFYAYSSDAYWLEIGTPEKYLQVHRDLLGGKSKLYSLASDKGVLIGEKSEVHRTAQIQGPVLVGANCSIGPRVKLIGPVVIGPGGIILEGSAIEQSVIWRNARMGPEATVKSSILADNCHLEANSVVEGAVLGDDVVVERGSRLEPGSHVWPGTRVAAKA
jgi:mannose-1-phosphate guanylyltransferase